MKEKNKFLSKVEECWFCATAQYHDGSLCKSFCLNRKTRCMETVKEELWWNWISLTLILFL